MTLLKCWPALLGLCAAFSLGFQASGLTIVFVDASSSNTSAPSDSNPGTSWSTAYKYLQNGLSRADQLLGQTSPPTEVQIWVADGNYRADQGSGFTPNDPAHSFELRRFVKIYGGFHGNPNGETMLTQADPLANIATLNGDINTINVASDNTYQVVVANVDAMTPDDTRLDGVTITGGYADDTFNYQYNGGGIYIANGASPRIHRCKVSYNYAEEVGGGISVESQLGAGIRSFACHHVVQHLI